MRVSEHYGLGVGQPALDFVNVDVVGDDRLYIDPRALRLLPTSWGSECVSLIQNFFDHVLDGIRQGERDETLSLLRQLREPNETHLGESRGRAQGRALGPRSAENIYDALSGSEAVKTGLIQDLEETALMVDGIAFDIISDIATNLIRGPLIEYTQGQADLLGIPLETQDSGPMWDPAGGWYNEMQDLPRAAGRKLLLVPKIIVRGRLHYNADDYFNNYVLGFLMDDEIARGTELVRLLKSERKRVYKKDLVEKYGAGKRAATRITLRNPQILDDYRSTRGAAPPTPYSHEDLLEHTHEEPSQVDWDGLLAAVKDVKPGGAGATVYHKAVQELLTALLYPSLAMPEREAEIHQGRKRIDIVYTNIAKTGFFDFFADRHVAPKVSVECKNYSSDPANPELDQLSGRFSNRRGNLGLLVCRSFKDKALFLERCRDTATDGRGYIIPLDDDDLTYLVGKRKDGDAEAITRFFHDRYNHLLS
jgi:hypothetical protein